MFGALHSLQITSSPCFDDITNVTGSVKRGLSKGKTLEASDFIT